MELDERVNGFFLVALAWTRYCIWNLGIAACDLRLVTCDDQSLRSGGWSCVVRSVVFALSSGLRRVLGVAALAFMIY